jgi:hypothetical protein
MVKENWRENLLCPNFDLKGLSFVTNNPTSLWKAGSKVRRDEKLSSSEKLVQSVRRLLLFGPHNQQNIYNSLRLQHVCIWGGKRSQRTALTHGWMVGGKKHLAHTLHFWNSREVAAVVENSQRVRSVETMPADAILILPQLWHLENLCACSLLSRKQKRVPFYLSLSLSLSPCSHPPPHLVNWSA